jgi:hypothetical protein
MGGAPAPFFGAKINAPTTPPSVDRMAMMTAKTMPEMIWVTTDPAICPTGSSAPPIPATIPIRIPPSRMTNGIPMMM